MAQNLLNAGFELCVYNRSEQKAKVLTSKGARLASSPAELARQVDLVAMCLSDDRAVREVIFGENGVCRGISPRGIVLDFSTISPTAAREFAKELEQGHQVRFLDAPVSGGDVGARAGTLSVMVGGDSETFSQLSSVFNAIGSSITHVGPCGAGQMTKCVNQLVVALTVAAMSEGLMLAESSGLDLKATLDVIRGGAAGSWSLDNYAPRLLEGDYQPGFRAEHMLKDMKFALAEASSLQTALPVSALVKEMYTQLCSSEQEPVGNHALIKLYRRLS
jgi:3-hydroxyisobutyrate dehydrogenase